MRKKQRKNARKGTQQCAGNRKNIVFPPKTSEAAENTQRKLTGRNVGAEEIEVPFPIVIKVEDPEDQDIKSIPILEIFVKPVADDGKHWKCHIGRCTSKFFTEEELRGHIDTKHTIQQPSRKSDRVIKKRVEEEEPVLEKEYTCKNCSKSFKEFRFFKKHMNRNVCTFICDCHGKHFKKRDFLLKHLMFVNNIRPLQCHICEKSYIQKSQFERHLLHHSDQGIAKEFKCDICDKILVGISAFKTHQILHSKEYQCALCLKCFGAQKYLRLHMMVHTNERPVKCPHCNKGFTQNSNMQKHARRHVADLPFKCFTCSMSFKSESALRMHNNRTHRNQDQHMKYEYYIPNKEKSIDAGEASGYPCVYCGITVKNRVLLRTHEKLRHEYPGPRRSAECWTCDLCGSNHLTYYKMKLHIIRVHRKQKMWCCQLCWKSFNCQEYLTRHLRTHNSDWLAGKAQRSHACLECGKVYARRDNLQEHMYHHTKEYPFNCSYAECEGKYGFTRKIFLKHHIQRIHVLGLKPRAPRVSKMEKSPQFILPGN